MGRLRVEGGGVSSTLERSQILSEVVRWRTSAVASRSSVGSRRSQDEWVFYRPIHSTRSDAAEAAAEAGAAWGEVKAWRAQGATVRAIDVCNK